MPGATIGATYASGSRSFDFSNLASEGVQAVEVYKTSRADIPSGGMGATINIVTPKPLEMGSRARSEEHTSELQSRGHLVCRLLLEKKKTKISDGETLVTNACRHRRCTRSGGVD